MIDNKTKWRTKDIKKLAKAVLTFSGQKFPRTLIIKYHKKWRNLYFNEIGGLGSVNGSWVTMFVPEIKHIVNVRGIAGNSYMKEVPTDFPIQRFAQVLIHEVGHNEGLRHKEMIKSKTIDIPDSLLQMKVEPQIEKPKRDIKEVRFEHAKEMLAANLKKLKRTQTQIKKWKMKVEYYENLK